MGKMDVGSRMANIDGIGGGQAQWRGGGCGVGAQGICDGGQERHLAPPATYLQQSVVVTTLHGCLQLTGEARDGKATHR